MNASPVGQALLLQRNAVDVYQTTGKALKRVNEYEVGEGGNAILPELQTRGLQALVDSILQQLTIEPEDMLWNYQCEWADGLHRDLQDFDGFIGALEKLVDVFDKSTKKEADELKTVIKRLVKSTIAIMSKIVEQIRVEPIRLVSMEVHRVVDETRELGQYSSANTVITAAKAWFDGASPEYWFSENIEFMASVIENAYSLLDDQ